MVAGQWGSWPCCIHSQEGERWMFIFNELSPFDVLTLIKLMKKNPSWTCLEICLQDDSRSCQVDGQHHHNLPGTMEAEISGTKLLEPNFWNLWSKIQLDYTFLRFPLNLSSSLDAFAFPEKLLSQGFSNLNLVYGFGNYNCFLFSLYQLLFKSDYDVVQLYLERKFSISTNRKSISLAINRRQTFK